MAALLKKHWFSAGILAAVLVTLADRSGTVATAGSWLKSHHGPDISVSVIFFLSGLTLNSSQIMDGIGDIRGTALAIVLMLIISPVLCLVFGLLPLSADIYLGLILVAVMPCTQSSGVVLTGAAGGNMAHALVVTILGNSLAVLTVPTALSLLLNEHQFTGELVIEQVPLMFKIASLVILPLLLGLVLRRYTPYVVTPLLPYASGISRIGILFVIWLAVCHGRKEILGSLDSAGQILLVTAGFHATLLAICSGTAYWARLEKGKRESVIIMGAQKTLPLALVLQASLFPWYPVAAVVCVVHHMVHLAMDSLLADYLRQRP